MQQVLVYLARLVSSMHQISREMEKAVFGGNADPQFSRKGWTDMN
jgi:hypothetical protein